jgi:hypothetical protein
MEAIPWASERKPDFLSVYSMLSTGLSIPRLRLMNSNSCVKKVSAFSISFRRSN